MANRERKIRWNTNQQDARIAATAQVLARNGGFGCVWIKRVGDGQFRLSAASETTGRDWKAPDETYPTVEAAVDAANERWNPA
jgi:hypothetical protein